MSFGPVCEIARPPARRVSGPETPLRRVLASDSPSREPSPSIPVPVLRISLPPRVASCVRVAQALTKVLDRQGKTHTQELRYGWKDSNERLFSIDPLVNSEHGRSFRTRP
jgi:hypothetical protein